MRYCVGPRPDQCREIPDRGPTYKKFTVDKTDDTLRGELAKLAILVIRRGIRKRLGLNLWGV
jgi:hypothetical protein